MRATEERSRLALRRLPASAKEAAAAKETSRAGRVARSQFARTFADVLAGRFGGRWSVEWQSADHSSNAEPSNGRLLPEK